MKEKQSFISLTRVLWSLALLLLSAGVWFYLRERPAEQAANYAEARVSRGDIELRVLSTAVVQPQNRLDIKPPIAGRIEDVLVAEGDAVKRGQIVAWMSSTERAALIDAARARGAEEVARWEQYYKATPIIAPIDGTIILQSIKPGQTFTTQDAVLVMSDRLTVKAQVDETDIGSIKLGQPARITLDAYPKHEMAGRVTQIAFDATTVNNVTTYLVDVLPEAIPSFMRSGMTANVHFVAARKEGALLLPAAAVHSRGERSFVLVPSAQGAVSVDIESGVSDGKQTEVLSGLALGARVILPKPPEAEAKRTNPFAPFSAKKK